MTLSKLSTSPYRHEFQKDTLGDAFYESLILREIEREDDPEWRKNNLEADLRSTDWILKKVREDDSYAQKVYAALCNNEFIKNEVLPLLKEETWACSWRYAGGIVAHMRETGDYMDWYCSGPGNEGTVDDEVREDFLKLGWTIKG